MAKLSKKDVLILEQEHRQYHRRLLYIFLLVVFILFSGATFYHYVENWRYLDSIYFVTATMTTIGYGDITPKTDLGKIFTIFFAFISVGIALYGLSLIASHFVEAREEFWFMKLGNIKLRQNTMTFWDKLKNTINFKSEELVKHNKHGKKD